jgi:hypothetical protein
MYSQLKFVFFYFSSYCLNLSLKFCIVVADIKTYLKIIMTFLYIIYMYVSLIAIKLRK